MPITRQRGSLSAIAIPVRVPALQVSTSKKTEISEKHAMIAFIEGFVIEMIPFDGATVESKLYLIAGELNFSIYMTFSRAEIFKI